MTVDSEDLPHRPVQVTDSNCRRAYSRMLSLLVSSPDLARVENRQELIADWKSEDSRKAFSERCLRKFQPDDLGCIIDAKDRDVLQACLLLLPG